MKTVFKIVWQIVVGSILIVYYYPKYYLKALIEKIAGKNKKRQE